MPQGPQRQVAESSLLLSKAQFSSFQVQDITYKTDLGVSGEGGTTAQKHPELLCTYCSRHPLPTSTPRKKNALVLSVSASASFLRTAFPAQLGLGYIYL